MIPELDRHAFRISVSELDNAELGQLFRVLGILGLRKVSVPGGPYYDVMGDPNGNYPSPALVAALVALVQMLYAADRDRAAEARQLDQLWREP